MRRVIKLARSILMAMGSEVCNWMELALECVQWRAMLLAMLKLRFLLLDTSLGSHCDKFVYFKYCILSLRLHVAITSCFLNNGCNFRHMQKLLDIVHKLFRTP
jgi:hypothetical protein